MDSTRMPIESQGLAHRRPQEDERRCEAERGTYSVQPAPLLNQRAAFRSGTRQVNTLELLVDRSDDEERIRPVSYKDDGADEPKP